MKFRMRVILLTMSAVFVPLFLSGAIFLYTEQQDMTESYSFSLENMAIHTCEDISSWLTIHKELIRRTASAPGIVRCCTKLKSVNYDIAKDKESQEDLERIAKLTTRLVPIAGEVRLSSPQTGLVFFSSNPKQVGTSWVPKEATNDKQLVELMRGDTIISQRVLVKTESSNDGSEDEELAGATGYISTAVKNGQQIVGILTVRVRPGSLSKVLLHPNVYLVDNHGRILSIPENNYDHLQEWLKRGNQNERTLTMKTPLGYPCAPLREYIAYQEGQPYYNVIPTPYHNISGELVIGAWSPCKELPWFVVAEMDRKELLAPAMDAMADSLIMVLIIAAIFIVLAWLASRSLTSPLLRLSHVANQLEKGNRSTRCNYKRRDEIGQFAEAFDAMADTIEKTLKELEVARDKALEASRTKSRFLDNMSHELRTPLNAIIGYSEMLMDEASDCGNQEIMPDLNNIHVAGVNLLSLINDILDVSKIEAGKMTIYCETISLEEMQSDLLALVKPLVVTHDNTFNMEVDPSIKEFYTDRTKLRQILLNLISNALKFTEKGQVTLIIKPGSAEDLNLPELTEAEKQALLCEETGQCCIDDSCQRKPAIPTDTPPRGCPVLFIVADNGIGMSQEQCAKIFDEFTQADNSVTRNHGGTGLGLTLVKHFTALLGGTVKVTSEMGKGSQFQVTLPTSRK